MTELLAKSSESPAFLVGKKDVVAMETRRGK